MNIFIQFERKPLFFHHPQRSIVCHRPQELKLAFQEIEYWVAQGFYVAGFVSYEAGYCFEPCFLLKERYDFPLLHMGVYRAPQENCSLAKNKGFSIEHVHFSCSFAQYKDHIHRIRCHIEQGDVYQITYCLKLLCDLDGDTRSVFGYLMRAQPVPYPAYIETDQYRILSLSPERFIKKQGKSILAEPMKGTWPRGKNIISDLAARFYLKCDPKNRAENVMIADLLRNDLGRIASNIRAPKLFTVAGYNTLFQMTSTVTGVLGREPTVYDVFAALFPSGSVTGAPKIRAMQIIHELEPFERKIYTGAIGYIAPNRDWYFNIPIRTLLLEGRKGEMGIGGGIVWDSTPEGEWNEGMLKARFLAERAMPCWSPKGLKR